MMNIFKRLFLHKLEPQKLIWLIGIPYTYEQFIAINDKSDYVELLRKKYSTEDIGILWAYYKKDVAINIQDTIRFLKEKGVQVVPFESLKDLENSFSYENIIITTHRLANKPLLEIMGKFLSIDRFIEAIPAGNKGFIDISSCYSSSFLERCKLKAPNTIFIAANTESSVNLRLFLYRHTVDYMSKHVAENYIDCLRIIIKRMLEGKSVYTESNADVFLGEKVSVPITYEPSARNDEKEVLCSIFSPQEIKLDNHLIIQVFVHTCKENELIEYLARESDRNAIRRDYTPLQITPQKGDRIKIEMFVMGRGRIILNSSKTIIWNERLSKTSFGCHIPVDIGCNELYGECNIYIGDVLIGDMRFVTKIVDAPRNTYSKILSRKFEKIFISYAHEDLDKVKYLATAYQAQGVDYFFDRHTLRIGDVYEKEIFDYIDNADLFILCWSKNAANSDYVSKEKKHALLLAHPRENSALKIFPISIEPRADLPSDMKDVYNFGDI